MVELATGATGDGDEKSVVGFCAGFIQVQSQAQHMTQQSTRLRDSNRQDVIKPRWNLYASTGAQEGGGFAKCQKTRPGQGRVFRFIDDGILAAGLEAPFESCDHGGWCALGVVWGKKLPLGALDLGPAVALLVMKKQTVSRGVLRRRRVGNAPELGQGHGLGGAVRNDPGEQAASHAPEAGWL